MVTWFQIKAYVIYHLKAKHRNGDGVHSPYVFALINDVILEQNRYYTYDIAEHIRTQYPNVYSTPAKYAKLIHRLAIHNKATNIVEFGTNIGLDTIYLATPNSQSKVITIEEQHGKATIAKNNFEQCELTNITIICDTIESQISKVVSQFDYLDLIYININHQYAQTINCYRQAKTKVRQQSIVIVDRPHLNENIERAWTEIINDTDVSLTIDLLKMGIAIFNNEIPKQHYILKY